MVFFIQHGKRFSLAVSLLVLAQARGALNDNDENRGQRLRKSQQAQEHRRANNMEPARELYPTSDGRKPKQTSVNITNEEDDNELIDLDDQRIVGGTNAAAGEFPFFVQGQDCAASLIWYDIALSAAHCSGSPWTSGVIIGNTRLDSLAGGALARNVVRQVPHPNYNDDTTTNDFLILKLNAEVPRTGTIQPIQINGAANSPAIGAPLTVIGFGDTVEGGDVLSPNLLKAVVNYVAPSTCNTAYEGEISSTLMLCAAAPGKDACQGDSGGPIINAAGVQVGVTSFGEGCARPAFPGVYARTSGAYSWIRSQVCALASNPPSYCGGTTGTLQSVVITVQHDSYPQETSWVLKNSAGQVRASQAANSVLQGNALVRRTLSLPAGTYTFVMNDTEADGICCEFGNGSFNIKVNGAVVASSNGVFGRSIQRQFTIGGTRSFTPSEWVTDTVGTAPADRKEEPAENPLARTPCVDSAEEMFQVNQEIGEQTCEWLRVNQENFGYLCELVRVATVCPDTCAICGSI